MSEGPQAQGAVPLRAFDEAGVLAAVVCLVALASPYPSSIFDRHPVGGRRPVRL
jgi:hypothetical protein